MDFIEYHLKQWCFFSMQMNYKLVRSVIFYSRGLSKRSTHLSLISVVRHVMCDWNKREREPLPACCTRLFAAAQCHCHSPAVLMCLLLSTPINVTLGRHAANGRAFKIGKRETLHLCFRRTWTPKRQNKSDIFSYISRIALIKMSQILLGKVALTLWWSSLWLNSSSWYPEKLD